MVGTEREKRHALYDGPWHFFESLMLFNEPKGLKKPTDVLFNEFTTWIQCHNMPLACMNPQTVRRIGETIGKVEEIDTGAGGNCIGQYARVRVTCDITKPLQRCVRIKTEDGEEAQTVILRYERLPEFCQACGRVGHSSRHCTDPTVDKEKLSYGSWLKAARAVEYKKRYGQGGVKEGGTTSSMMSSKERAIVVGGKEGDHISKSNDEYATEQQNDAAATRDLEGEDMEIQLTNEHPQTKEHNIIEEERRLGRNKKPKKEKCKRARGGADREEKGGEEKTLITAGKRQPETIRGWKRRARLGHNQPQATSVDMLDENEVSMGYKRKGEMVKGADKTQKRTKPGQKETEMVLHELTAEAAEQPRRSQ